jgi:acetyl esterase/lipase
MPVIFPLCGECNVPYLRAALILLPTMAGLWLPALADEIRIIKNVPYGPNPEEILDVCMPKTPAGHLPGIVLIHGGGWSWGAKEGPVRDCTFMAQHGYVVANIDYRLGDSKDPHGAPWPAQLLIPEFDAIHQQQLDFVSKWLRP